MLRGELVGELMALLKFLSKICHPWTAAVIKKVSKVRCVTFPVSPVPSFPVWSLLIILWSWLCKQPLAGDALCELNLSSLNCGDDLRLLFLTGGQALVWSWILSLVPHQLCSTKWGMLKLGLSTLSEEEGVGQRTVKIAKEGNCKGCGRKCCFAPEGQKEFL